MDKKQKHCSRLWNALLIRHDGHVYPCCQFGPDPKHAIGNLKENSLKEIINGAKIQKMREDSLNGCLSCYDGCNQVKYFEGYPIPRPDSTSSSLEHYEELQIEYGERCNTDCEMCWQDRNNPVMLSYEDLNQKVPTENWKNIIAYGGEVFVMKDAYRHVLDILKCGQRNLTIITNGLALSSESLSRKIVQNGQSLIISINAMSEESHNFVMRPRRPFYKELLKTVKKLQVLKKEYCREDFLVVGQFTVMRETLFEIPDFISNFRQMGFDKASITFDHRYFPSFFDSHPEIVETLAPMIQKSLEPVKESWRVTLNEHERFVSKDGNTHISQSLRI